MIGVIEETVDKVNVDNMERERGSVYETPQKLNKKSMDGRSSTKNKPKSFDLTHNND